jgi:hypothetical protein
MRGPRGGGRSRHGVLNRTHAIPLADGITRRPRITASIANVLRLL